MLATIRNMRINLPSPSVYSPPGLIGPWLIHTCPNHFSFVSCEYESILFFFSLSRKQRRTAVLEINKKCLTSFEKLGEAIYKQEKEIVYFFSLHFSRYNLFEETWIVFACNFNKITCLSRDCVLRAVFGDRMQIGGDKNFNCSWRLSIMVVVSFSSLLFLFFSSIKFNIYNNFIKI